MTFASYSLELKRKSLTILMVGDYGEYMEISYISGDGRNITCFNKLEKSLTLSHKV